MTFSVCRTSQPPLTTQSTLDEILMGMGGVPDHLNVRLSKSGQFSYTKHNLIFFRDSRRRAADFLRDKGTGIDSRHLFLLPKAATSAKVSDFRLVLGHPGNPGRGQNRQQSMPPADPKADFAPAVSINGGELNVWLHLPVEDDESQSEPPVRRLGPAGDQPRIRIPRAKLAIPTGSAG